MAALGRAATRDDILVSIHPRRLGIVGDGQAGDPSALILDGSVIASTRLTTPFIAKIVTGLSAAGAVTLAGTAVGDTVVSVSQISATISDISSSFESTISVAGQIQQTTATDLSAKQALVIVWPRS